MPTEWKIIIELQNLLSWYQPLFCLQLFQTCPVWLFLVVTPAGPCALRKSFSFLKEYSATLTSLSHMIWEVIRAGQEIFYQLVRFFKIFTNFIHPVHPDIQGVAKEWFGHISFFHFGHSFHLIKKQCQIQSGIFLLMHSKLKSLIITKKIIFERAQVTPPLHMTSEYYLYQDHLFVCKSSLSITQVCKIIECYDLHLWKKCSE